MDVQVRAQKVLDKCEAMSLLCSKSANYWNIVKTAFQIPLILINSLLCIMNSLGQENGMNMKMPNIIINGISVLLLSFQSNFKVPEKVELFKNLGNQFLLIAHSIEALDEEDFIKDACEQLNHHETEICVTIEREFLHRLEGGCTAPIGAIAYVNEKTQEVNFKGVLLSKDGKKKIEVAKNAPLNKHRYLAKDCADYIINRGGKQLILDDIDIREEVSTRVFSTKSLAISQTKLFHKNIVSESSDFIKVRSNRIPSKAVKEFLENVIITSKNGVEALLDNFTKEELNFKHIYCVGRRTKKLIQQKIGAVNHAEKNAAKLAEYLSKEMEGDSVTYFCSDLRLDTLTRILTENKIKVNEVEAYKTMYSPEVVSKNIKGVLFFSPSAIESYLQKNTADKVAFCIGASTAKEAYKYFEKVEIAQIPTVESVIELVNLHYVQ